MAGSRITRRAVMGAAAGTVGALALGGLGVARFDDNDVIRSTLRRLVGDFRMDDAAFATFVTDFKDEFGRFEGLQAAFFRIGEFGNAIPMIANLAPAALSEKIESFERALLINFLFTTNYLQLASPATDQVEYAGRISACTNPFARFD